MDEQSSPMYSWFSKLMVATATTTETITTTCSFVRGLLYFYNLHNHKVFEITPTLYQGFSDSAIYCFLKYLILA